MEAKKDQNLPVNNQSEEELQHYLLTKSEYKMSENLMQREMEKKPSIQQQHYLLTESEYRLSQDQTPRDSTSQSVSLANCRCSCHEKCKKDDHPLIEEEESKSMSTEYSTPMMTSSQQSSMMCSAQSSEIPEQVSLKESAPLNQKSTPSVAIDLSLDKLSVGKFCDKCGKLKTKWLFKENAQKNAPLETVSEKSEEHLSEIAIANDKLNSSQSTIARESTGVSDEKSSLTAHAGSFSMKSDVATQSSMSCHHKCKAHCPKEFKQPVEEERLVTASDKLMEDCASIESLEKSLPLVKDREAEEPPQSTPVPAPIAEKLEEKRSQKKEEIESPKAEEQKVSRTPPRVIVSLVDMDQDDNRQQQQQQPPQSMEKGTQSPSAYDVTASYANYESGTPRLSALQERLSVYFDQYQTK